MGGVTDTPTENGNGELRSNFDSDGFRSMVHEKHGPTLSPRAVETL